MRHGNRTRRGDQLKAQHQERYQKWWLGKYVNESTVIDDIQAKGKIVAVEYIGNSVYGVVMLRLENGCELPIGHRLGKGRPTKSCLTVYDEPQ